MKISGFENIISIERFEYQNCMDSHVLCSFSACIKADDVDSALGMVDSDIDFEDDNFKFTGHVTDVAVSNDISGAYIEVKTIGKTYLCDQDRYSRVFQQGDKTISDILSHMKSMSDIEFQGKNAPVIENIIFQNDDTEWVFIRRLVNRLGFHIFSQDKAFIGEYGSNQVEIEEEKLIDYRINVGSKASYMICRMDTSFEIGTQVKYSGKQYYVGSKKYVLEKEKYYYEYVLYEIKDGTDVQEESIDTYLYAKVTDNNDPDKKGRLRVDFENESIEDCMKDSPIWIDRIDTYASKGLGPIYIPQIDDTVRVHLHNGDSKIVGCVRTDAYGSPYENCDNKYFLLDDDIFIQYGDGKLTIHDKDNQVEVSGEEISITSGDKVSIVAAKDKVLMQKDKAVIEITSDINASGGKFIVEAKGDASIIGTSVNIKGKSGVSIN